MNPKLFWLITAIVLVSISRAEAQQPKKIPRVGFLGYTTGNPARFGAFQQGMRELGYVDGKNILIERRNGDRLAPLATELVVLNVDVIVTGGSTGTQAAKDATSTIPIVMAQDNDPLGSGFVASLAKPVGTSPACPLFPQK